jgi:hypothetical protein
VIGSAINGHCVAASIWRRSTDETAATWDALQQSVMVASPRSGVDYGNAGDGTLRGAAHGARPNQRVDCDGLEAGFVSFAEKTYVRDSGK